MKLPAYIERRQKIIEILPENKLKALSVGDIFNKLYNQNTESKPAFRNKAIERDLKQFCLDGQAARYRMGFGIEGNIYTKGMVDRMSDSEYSDFTIKTLSDKSEAGHKTGELTEAKNKIKKEFPDNWEKYWLEKKKEIKIKQNTESQENGSQSSESVYKAKFFSGVVEEIKEKKQQLDHPISLSSYEKNWSGPYRYFLINKASTNVSESKKFGRKIQSIASESIKNAVPKNRLSDDDLKFRIIDKQVLNFIPDDSVNKNVDYILNAIQQRKKLEFYYQNSKTKHKVEPIAIADNKGLYILMTWCQN
jgi:hypothetical protein